MPAMWVAIYGDIPMWVAIYGDNRDTTLSA